MSERLWPGQVPRDVFEVILENMPLPTFDLVLEVPDRGILIARRKIAPYKDKWALPGLRQYKGERIKGTLGRIARDEAGVEIDAAQAKILGQDDGFFRTEHGRQDTSTGYAVTALSSEVSLNEKHFSGHRFITEPAEIPSGTGAMYRRYLNLYFEQQVQA